MRPSTASIQVNLLRKGLLIGLACAAVAALSPRAHADAADPAEITISASPIKIVGYNRDLTPKEQISYTARVPFEPVTLTTNSGVALLKDRVLQAAREACSQTDPLVEEDDRCVLNAIKDAQPQMDAAIAKARSSSANQ
ncbi:MAG: UrcA family protein [Gammaproteobacteria bacterium]